MPTILLTLLGVFYICIHSTNNKKSVDFAKISKNEENSFTLKIFKEGSHMPHSPTELKKNKFTDSITLIIPKSDGKVIASEITRPSGYYKYVRGEISLTPDSVAVNLYYDNYDDHLIEPFSFNGIYRLYR